MTKTPNYALPQWERTDQVKMSDFNEAFAILDAARPAVGVLDTYDGKSDVTVDLGRQPKMVMVGNKIGWTNTITSSSTTSHAGHTVALPGYPGYRSYMTSGSSMTQGIVLEVTETGFTLRAGLAPEFAPFYYLAIF